MIASFFRSMIWVLLLLIAAGLLLHLMVQYGFLSSIAKWIGRTSGVGDVGGGV